MSLSSPEIFDEVITKNLNEPSVFNGRSVFNYPIPNPHHPYNTIRCYTRSPNTLIHVEHMFAKLNDCFASGVTCWDCTYPKTNTIHDVNRRHPAQVVEPWEV